MPETPAYHVTTDIGGTHTIPAPAPAAQTAQHIHSALTDAGYHDIEVEVDYAEARVIIRFVGDALYDGADIGGGTITGPDVDRLADSSAWPPDVDDDPRYVATYPTAA